MTSTWLTFYRGGCDIFSHAITRFGQPCGLNQMYSQRYGTIPVVKKAVGWRKLVVNTLPETIANLTASSMLFNEASSSALLEP